MNAANAKPLAVVSVLVAGGLSATASFGEGHIPPLRIGVGALFAGVVLTTMAEVAPQLSVAFSMLVLLSSVFVYGGPAFAAINRATNRK